MIRLHQVFNTLNSSLEVLFTPAEFSALRHRDLSQTVCVVFDVLRATSTMITALANRAKAIIPVREIAEALSLRKQDPEVLLAGERNGFRIGRDLTGSIDFDLGNSPREFTAERVCGRTIVMTTTNGTRALQACKHAQAVLVGSFLNLAALTKELQRREPATLLVICSGTHEEAAYEDTLAAGALCDSLWSNCMNGHVADSAQIARQIFLASRHDLTAAMRCSRNARRLLGIPELADDVAYCLQRDVTSAYAVLRDGRVIAQSA